MDYNQSQGGWENSTKEFRRDAMAVQTAFAAMRPLVFKSQILSSNAEITSAHLGDSGLSFGIIARELMTMVRELERLIDELQKVFREVAVNSAEWIKAEHRREIFQRAMSMAQGGDGTEAQKEKFHGLCEKLTENSKASQESMYENIRVVIDLSRKINKFIDRISWVAVRQSHFTAITARVEAAKMEDNGKDIEAVASAIRHLSEEIADAERQARERIHTLNGQAKNLSKQINLVVTRSR